MKLVPPSPDPGMYMDDAESSGKEPATEHAQDANSTRATAPKTGQPIEDDFDPIDLSKRLIVYADDILRRRTWRGNAASGAPGGQTAEDFVQESFKKYFAGERRRPPDVPWFDFFAGVIRSLISHLVETPENRHAHDFFVEADVGGPGLLPITAVADVAYESPEACRLARDSVKEVRCAFSSDDRMQQYLSLVESERYDTVSELAEALRVSIAVVANLRKRLRRWFKRQMRDGEDQP